MKQKELKLILEKHNKWLAGEEGGERADLSSADLSRANLDYSCWPLWCGSLGVKGDEALVGQLLFHVFDFARSSGVDVSSVMKIRNAIKKSSPITKHEKEVPI